MTEKIQTGALPLVSIAGRPNVGKSTLFNRLVGRREAIVSDQAGVTRDRKEAVTTLRGRRLRLVDTAGLEEGAPESLAGRMTRSSETSIGQADLVLFCIDGRTGLTAGDRHFAQWLRRRNRPVLLVVNKAEGKLGSQNLLEAYELGLGEPVAVSAEHGEGIAGLMADIAGRMPPAVETLPEDRPPDAGAAPAEDEESRIVDSETFQRPLRLAIVGRPNAGKSTLLNALLGEERMITGPEAGLTRDAVSVDIADGEGSIQLIDTAGLRKKARIRSSTLEKMSVSATVETIKRADVVILVVDAARGLDEQDLQIARLIEKEGRACVIALNKWDAVKDQKEARNAILDRLSVSLAQLPGVQIVTFSALTGRGIQGLFPAAREAAGIWSIRIGTGALNRWFQEALERHPPPLAKGRRLKLRYVTQARTRPPTFIVFGTRVDQIPESYKRYLINGLRNEFGLKGAPVRLQLRASSNPFRDNGK